MFPEQLEQRLVGSRDTVVLPSEVVAAFWRRHILTSTNRTALRSDHVLSWDAFKERYFGRRQRRRPVDALQRTIFALRFLEAHRKKPTLQVLVPPAYASESRRFLTNIRAVLPLLPRLQVAAAHVSALSADLQAVRKHYDAYLETVGCFEPSWVEIDVPRIKDRHLIVFPELMEDFPEFEEALRGSATVEVVSAGRYEAASAASLYLEQFSDSRREIDALFGRLERILDSGVSASDIAITVGNLDELIEVLTQEAERREIPLRIRTGRTLSEFPAGRLFNNLARCEQTGFSLESIKQLLLDRSVPWRNRHLNELLVRFGADCGCLANGRNDLWNHALTNASKRLSTEEADAHRAELRELYRGLTRNIRAIVHARSFPQIKQQLYGFLRAFLDTNAWDETNERVFQRCVDLLDDLASAAGKLQVSDPFSLYVMALGEKLYVERNETGGVNVYPYRVSAGILPQHHFLVNASRRTTEVQIDPFRFLSDPLRDELGLSVNDVTDHFWEVYTLSGRNVYPSFAEVSAAGPELAPGSFVAEGRIVAPEENIETPFRHEARWWGRHENSIDSVYPTQRRGLDHALVTAFVSRGPDYAEQPIASAELVDTAATRQASRTNANAIGMSPTHLEAFLACPFSYLASRVLGLEENSWIAEVERPQDIGSLYHHVLESFFARLKEEGRPIRETSLADYETAIREELGEAASGWARRNTSLHPVVLSARLEAIADNLVCLVRRQVSRLEGYRVVATEQWYTATLGFDIEQDADTNKPATADRTVSLFGKIDRIDRSSATGGHVLLDYKKSGVPTKGAVIGITGHGREVDPSSYQIPFYLFLADENGISVDEAGYESIEKRKYTSVFGDDGYFDDDGLPAIRERLLDTVSRVAERITGGDYRCNEETCESCAFRSFCRRKFAVRA